MADTAREPMRVLVSCEFSGRVRDAFRALGHDAVSCDLLPTEVPGPHIRGDFRDLLSDVYFGRSEPYDLLIAHPPCTYLCNSGVRWLFNKDGTEIQERMAKVHEAHNLFWDCLNTFPKVARSVCVENPIPHKYAKLPDYTQKIQPWQFGDFETKATCLWLRNLPSLTPTAGFKDRRFVKNRLQRVHLESPGPERSKNRSRTYYGIAAAMAEQWGGNAIPAELAGSVRE